MPFFTDLNTYLHRSSQLIQAYPSTRITTKYSLPKKPSAKSDAKGREKKESSTTATTTTAADPSGLAPTQPKREPSAILTLKTYHPDSGICLKYKTDKAAEVGRLLAGLGRLAKGELIEPPTAAATTTTTTTAANDADKMDIDSGIVASEAESKVVVAPPAATQTASGGGGGGKGKKKKGKK